MKRYEDIGKEQLHDLLAKGWLTHDGTWFLSAAGEFGIETANRLNKAAIRTLAPLEMQRCRKLLLEEGEELAGVAEMIPFMLESLLMIMPSSVSKRFRLTYPGPKSFRWEWEEGEPASCTPGANVRGNSASPLPRFLLRKDDDRCSNTT